MRLIRFSQADEPPQYGWLRDDHAGPIEGDPFRDYRRLEAAIPIDRIRLLPPVRPSKIVCIGRNYPAHAAEHGSDVPTAPLLFLKPPSALIGPGDSIRLPPQSERVEHEAELVVVIGSMAHRVSTNQAMDHVYGFTLGNDVTARDLQRQDNQWTRAKGFDTFCPLGPWIETDFNPADAIVTCRVNGELKQMGSTRDMVFDIPELITYITSVMTLFPGDLIMTGTPSGVSPLAAGDVVEVAIEGLGVLGNPVAAG
ncbi:MAG TPA: fumarylacetoacetate hydrolase family protein [Anaerolineales bacterium]|nr:fumarylacetoacetate hydrolase family protein [Anaerolineales bacterium]